MEEEQNNDKTELCIKSILLNLIQLQFVLLIYSMRFYFVLNICYKSNDNFLFDRIIDL